MEELTNFDKLLVAFINIFALFANTDRSVHYNVTLFTAKPATFSADKALLFQIKFTLNKPKDLTLLLTISTTSSAREIPIQDV